MEEKQTINVKTVTNRICNLMLRLYSLDGWFVYTLFSFFNFFFASNYPSCVHIYQKAKKKKTKTKNGMSKR